MRKFITIIAFLTFAIWNVQAKNTTDNTPISFTTQKANLSNCTPPTTQVDLDINNVRVTLLGAGDMWWDKDVAKYQYPKIDETSGAIPKNVFFLGGLWITGKDDGDGLRCSSQLYNGNDFYSGPIKTGGTITPDVCDAFDKHFVVYGEDISDFRAEFDASQTISEANIPDQIKFWPGKGNPWLLNSDDPQIQDLYFTEGALAPFFDYNGDEIYDPINGDYPVIKTIFDSVENKFLGNYADQMIFWVINDVGNTHTNTNGTEIGIQVNCLAFAFQTSNELNDMTFYTYEIIKKTAGDLTGSFMSIATDPDIGDSQDDFIGCDTVRNIGFCFNGDNDDPDYGSGPPLVGVDFFEGPVDDNGAELGLYSFMYFDRLKGENQRDPVTAQEYRFYQEGKWKDGTLMRVGGDGLTGATGPVTTFAYPGNPGLGEYWSECNVDNLGNRNQQGDRRFVQTSGPFKLSSAQIQRISIGVMVVETNPNTYDGCPDYEALIGSANNRAQFLFDNNFGIIDGPDAPDLKIREMENALVINLINKKSSNNFAEQYESEAAGANPVLGQTDTLYLFEGYKVFQLKTATITAKDLNDEAKAKIVYQSDIKNHVSLVYDYVFDNMAMMYVPVLKASGENKGIVKSFQVETDLFADGESGLINYKTYYYAVVAYAYNNYKQFNSLDTLNGASQIEQYLQGRRNFKVYSAIPHNVSSENAGTILNSKYGQGVEVKRLEGEGNGGRHIELTDETKADILINNFTNILVYKPLFDPLGIKVIDPLTVQNVDFELVIKNEGANTVTDSSTWELSVFKDGTFVETIKSNRIMDRPYNQIIEDYGIVVNVGTPLSVDTNFANNNSLVYDYLNSEITYVNENKKWLSFVKDAGNLEPLNWIMSGSNIDITSGYLEGIWDGNQYDELNAPDNVKFYDSTSLFSSMLGGGFAPYCLANNYRVDIVKSDGAPGSFLKSSFSTFGPGFIWEVWGGNQNNPNLRPKNSINTLDKIQSIDIVMTSDKTKWSKCVVFETGENDNLTIGGARKGMLRQSESIDVDGKLVFDDNGRSYFPGYAINLETGKRLNIAFGESSQRVDNNGSDMIWNPTDKITDVSTKIPSTEHLLPVYGGKHFIYVFDTEYDGGNAVQLAFETNYNPTLPLATIPTEIRDVYKSIMYTSMPYLTKGFELKSLEEGIIPNDDTIKIRVSKPYKKLYTSETLSPETNDSMPRYSFSTVGMAPVFNDNEMATSVLDNIRVVPNPYYAFSAYEVSPNSSIVKITNLPDVCKISIYTLDGKLVKRYDRALGSEGNIESNKQDLSLAQPVGTFNLDNSQIWNLKNHKDIPVSSGTYLIYIDAPGIGHQIVKSVVFVRPPDITNF